MAVFDTEQWTPWIGHTLDLADTVTPRLVQSYCAVLAPHLAAVEASHAPLGLHWCLAPQITSTSELGPDGHPAAGRFLPPMPLPRRVWAGGEIEILAPFDIGDHVTRRSTITSIRAKDGRKGPLCLVTVQHELAIKDRVAIRERQDLAYQNAPTRVSSADRTPLAAGEDVKHSEAALTWTVHASSVLLMRYSALTFNGHRIHYDLPYATAAEGYDGLVVHGPLQATLLLNLAATLLGKCPSRFTYRAVAPLIAGQSFTVNGAPEHEGLINCRVLDVAGRVTVEATAAR